MIAVTPRWFQPGLRRAERVLEADPPVFAGPTNLKARRGISGRPTVCDYVKNRRGSAVIRLAVILAALLVVIMVPLASPAAAQVPCGDRGLIVARLAERYEERQIGMGVADGGGTIIYEVWANPANGSFTMLRSHLNGVSCILATGSMWTAPAAPAEGDPA